MAAVPSLGRAAGVEPRPLAVPEVDATRALYERYARQVHSYCLRQLRSREEAEDAVQTTFMNAFRGLQRGVVPAVEQAWLFKIAENVCLSRRRSSWRRGRVESPNDLAVLQEIIPSQSYPRDELIGLEDALSRIPENQRRAILLREWQGLSYREIAAELDISQPAVETLIFRARRSLAEALEQPEPKTKRSRLRAGSNGVNVGAVFTAIKSALTGGAAVKAVVVAVAAGTATIAAGDPSGLLRHGSRIAPAVQRAPSVGTAIAAPVAVGAGDNAHRFAPTGPESSLRAHGASASHRTAATLPTVLTPSVEPAPDDAAAVPPADVAPSAPENAPTSPANDENPPAPTADDPPRSSNPVTPGDEIRNVVGDVDGSAIAPPTITSDPPAAAAPENAADTSTAPTDPALGTPAADLAAEPAPNDGDAEPQPVMPPTSNAGGNDTAVAGASSNAGGNDTAVAGANSNAGGNDTAVAGENSNAGGNDTAVAGANSNAGGNGGSGVAGANSNAGGNGNGKPK